MYRFPSPYIALSSFFFCDAVLFIRSYTLERVVVRQEGRKKIRDEEVGTMAGHNTLVEDTQAEEEGGEKEDGGIRDGVTTRVPSNANDVKEVSSETSVPSKR